MEDILIPPFFQHNLIHGIPPPCITKLRDWQKELLSTEEWKQKKKHKTESKQGKMHEGKLYSK